MDNQNVRIFTQINNPTKYRFLPAPRKMKVVCIVWDGAKSLKYKDKFKTAIESEEL